LGKPGYSGCLKQAEQGNSIWKVFCTWVISSTVSKECPTKEVVMYPHVLDFQNPAQICANCSSTDKVQQTPPLNQAWLGLVQEALGDQPCRWA